MVNPAGGAAAARGGALAPELAQLFAAVGLRAEVRMVAGGDLAAAVTAAASAPLVVVGGGDGTLGCAAGALAEAGGGAALGILPLGTRNHLAAELGIPTDLAAAVRLLATDARRRIDLGRVNGRHFVNNASIGFYPAMVERRDALRARLGLPKALANLPAAWATLARARHHRLQLLLDGERRPVRTPLLFVGNNRYRLDRRAVGTRARLDEGVLSVFAVGPRGRAGLVALALRTLAGRADPDGDYAALGAARAFTVRPHRREIAVALDGEVARLRGPLRFECLPGALAVAAPAA